jgi:hypothetical protein
MTVMDQIIKEAKTLSPPAQRKVLKYTTILARQTKPKAGRLRVGTSRTPTTKPGKLHPALQAVAGMWKDRTDLPKSGAAAARVLASRVMRRQGHD